MTLSAYRPGQGGRAGWPGRVAGQGGRVRFHAASLDSSSSKLMVFRSMNTEKLNFLVFRNFLLLLF